MTAAAGIFADIFRVIGLAGVRQSIFRSADRANQRSDGAKLARGAGSIRAIFHRLPIGFAAMALGRHEFVEVIIEEHDLPRDFLATERLELIEISHDDDFRGESGSAA